MAVYNFGSINIDHVYKVPHLVRPGETISSHDYQSVLGGKGANQSISLAQAGIKTFHVGAINQADDKFIEAMQAFKVDCQFVNKLASTASGHAIIQVDEQAENAIFLFGGANQTLSNEHIDKVLETANSDDHVLIQNETNALEYIIKAAKSRNMQVIFNPAPMTPSVKSLPLQDVDLFVLNQIEAQELSEQSELAAIKAALLNMFPHSNFVITVGKHGACYLSKDEDIQVNAFEVEALDTTAAGDTFIGYYLAGLALGKSIKEALRFGCAASAIAVTKNGASTSIPTLQDVNDFLNKSLGSALI